MPWANSDDPRERHEQPEPARSGLTTAEHLHAWAKVHASGVKSWFSTRSRPSPKMRTALMSANARLRGTATSFALEARARCHPDMGLGANRTRNPCFGQQWTIGTLRPYRR